MAVSNLFSQSFSIVYFVAPTITAPIGTNNGQFWSFIPDSNVIYKNITAKKFPLEGICAGISSKFEFKSNHPEKFTIESGLTYYLKRYNISWIGEYDSISQSVYTGSVNVSYKIIRNVLGLTCLPGFNFKRISFNTGINLLVMVTNYSDVKFMKGGTFIVNYKGYEWGMESTSPINISVPIVLSYSISISRRWDFAPFINCEIGLFDWDGFALGDAPAKQVVCLNELMLGANFIWHR